MTNLNGHDQQIYDAIFRHPTSGNIEWTGILSLFSHIGEVTHEPNGKVRLMRNGQAITIRPSGKDAEIDEVAEVRKLIQISKKPSDSADEESGDYLLVLVHSEAQIYRTLTPESVPIHIEPYDPSGWDKHVHDAHENALGHLSTQHREFFERISTVLANAKRILLFSGHKGSGQESERFLDDIKRHHKELADRIIETEPSDLSHMSEGEILAKAREILADQEPSMASR